MSLLRILKFPAPALKRRATDVASIDGRVDELLRDMAETMYAAPGVGLAAPQVGVAERVITIDTNHEEPGKHLLKLVNPVIVERDGTVLWEEGCLSVVDYQAEVRRSAKVLVKAWTVDQQELQIEADGLLAVAFQHEIDHLDGKLFIDRLSGLKRDSYKRRLSKMIRDGVDLDTFKPPRDDAGI
jgi:peptide deformylase